MPESVLLRHRRQKIPPNPLLKKTTRYRLSFKNQEPALICVSFGPNTTFLFFSRHYRYPVFRRPHFHSLASLLRRFESPLSRPSHQSHRRQGPKDNSRAGKIRYYSALDHSFRLEICDLKPKTPPLAPTCETLPLSAVVCTPCARPPPAPIDSWPQAVISAPIPTLRPDLKGYPALEASCCLRHV